MKRERELLILDILDELFYKVCIIFDWIENRITKKYKRKII